MTVTGFLQRVGPALIRSGDVPRTRPTTPRSAAAETGFSALPLRLIAARGGVGIELYEAQPFGPLTLSELSWSLPGLSFPLDLSGGVREFRHRRGQVQHAVLALDPVRLASWSFGHSRDALGGLDAPIGVWFDGAGIGFGASGADGAVAFELLWAPTGNEARWVIHNPRSAGALSGPAVTHAFLLVDRLLGKWARRRGRILEFGAVLSELCRAFLPSLGVKVPSSAGLWFGPLSQLDEMLVVGAAAHPPVKELPASTQGALEFAELVQSADELLFQGNIDAARAGYMTALERAPRHPELCRTIASIDLDFEERSEAALGLLVEALPVTAFGSVGAELLSRVGDEDGAEQAIARQVDRERYSPLAAWLWLRASQLTTDTRRRAAALDRALAACPSAKAARLARFELRLEVGDLNGATADAEHLEAAMVGSRDKHRAILAAAQAMHERGFVQPARRLFERALRYLPKDPAATLGLARCFASDDDTPRALVLLRRAAELVSDGDPLGAEVDLELAKALATTGRDLPQAIARVRRVHGRDALAIEARALEARWRAQLGDDAGAAVAYGRLCDAIELSGQRRREHASFLLEGARLSREMGEVAAAVRQASLALSLAPNEPAVLGTYRDLKALAAGRRPHPEPSAPALEEPPATPRSPTSSASAGAGAEAAAGQDVEESAVELEARADELLRQLMAGVELDAEQLTVLERGLSSAGRDQELHAWLWARFEDAAPPQQRTLAPRLESLLERLIERGAGSGEDVGPYEAQLLLLRQLD